MLDKNELPHDFHRQAKWVNVSQFYILLVEPLEIAEYYRSNMHHVKGHYLKHGRERRFEIFDRWWREKRVNEEENTRLVERKEVSEDVVAKNSSYKKLLEELTELRSAVHPFWTATQFPSLRGGEVVP
ncbi:hypothetical protein ACE6H2_015286 [Prunus campanulata]